MKRLATAAALFLGLMFMAVIHTALVYSVVYGVAVLISYAFDLLSGHPWIPLATSVLVFLAGLVTAIRKRIPDLSHLSWDSGTAQECPSRVSLQGAGGYLWNMNPLGPRSAASIVAVCGALLCAGPALVVSAFAEVIDAIRESRRT